MQGDSLAEMNRKNTGLSGAILLIAYFHVHFMACQ
jgi:hypothetical protein